MKLAVMLLLALPMLAQTPQFEAAAVSVSKTLDAKPAGAFLPGGEYTARSTDLRTLMVVAFHVQPSQITGAPAWFDNQRYDITAKAPPQTRLADLRLMIEQLLKDRFQLKYHRQEKVAPAFALTVGPQGAKLKPSDASQPMSCLPAASRNGLLHMTCTHVETASLPDALKGISGGYLAGAPVVDQTGLSGVWEFTLEWTQLAQYRDAPQPGQVSFFDAVEAQLGLRLTDKKLPLAVIAIDYIERIPREN